MVASKASDIPEWKSKYCPCKGCGVAREEGRQEIIRVMLDLMKYYEGKDYESNPMGYGQLKNDSNSISYKVAANNIWKALEGK